MDNLSGFLTQPNSDLSDEFGMALFLCWLLIC